MIGSEPPVGIVLFMTTGISGVKLEPLSKAVFPFVVWMIICVILMVYFPWLTRGFRSCLVSDNSKGGSE